MNTIIAKSYVNIRDEKIANGNITPGMLVKRLSTDRVVAHSTAGGAVAPLFAIEDENQGNDIDDVYAAAALVKLWRPVPGEQVQAIASANATYGVIAIGDFVESDGTGRLRRADSVLSSAGKDEFPNSFVGVALSVGAPSGRFVVEVL